MVRSFFWYFLQCEILAAQVEQYCIELHKAFILEGKYLHHSVLIHVEYFSLTLRFPGGRWKSEVEAEKNSGSNIMNIKEKLQRIHPYSFVSGDGVNQGWTEQMLLN